MSTPSNSFVPDARNTAELRRAFGRFGTGVTVITTQSAIGPLGMTANSFSSISLDPALVMWSPAKSSARHDAFVEAPHFAVHVLAADQLDLARHFATQGQGFEGFDWSAGTAGVPILTGCLAVFECAHFAKHPAGDHSIVLGSVMRVSEDRPDADGLMFDQGRFGVFTPL